MKFGTTAPIVIGENAKGTGSGSGRAVRFDFRDDIKCCCEIASVYLLSFPSLSVFSFLLLFSLFYFSRFLRSLSFKHGHSALVTRIHVAKIHQEEHTCAFDFGLSLLVCTACCGRCTHMARNKLRWFATQAVLNEYSRVVSTNTHCDETQAQFLGRKIAETWYKYSVEI